MPLKIVRNDITKMNTQAVVNTASAVPVVGPGCDSAIYKAAGHDELLAYRSEKIGFVEEGDAFITPGFNLQAKYIIHAVSPLYEGGDEGEEEKLRSCYRKSLKLAQENGIKSVAFPLISTGGFGYPKEEGMRIAVDEIGAFLQEYEMDVYLVVFDDAAHALGRRIDPALEAYIDRNYVEEKQIEEYGDRDSRRERRSDRRERSRGEFVCGAAPVAPSEPRKPGSIFKKSRKESVAFMDECAMAPLEDIAFGAAPAELDFEEVHESKLEERMRHLADTFSEYLMYLIAEKQMENADVYKRAIVDKKIFSKIKNNVDYHPQKLTALCLCVGAKLNLDETKDLLARAGYALSPCDKTDIIFSYFIENEIYDMIELDIQLEEHGLPCIIS